MFQCCLQRVIWMWSVCGSVHYTHCSLVDSAQNGLRVTVSTRTQCSHHSELQRSRNIVLLCGQFTRTCPSPFFFFFSLQASVPILHSLRLPSSSFPLTPPAHVALLFSVSDVKQRRWNIQYSRWKRAGFFPGRGSGSARRP